MSNKLTYSLLFIAMYAACCLAQPAPTAAPGTGSASRELIRSFMAQVQELISNLTKSLQELSAASTDGSRISIS